MLSDQERAELTVNARSRSLPASDVQRARVILLLAEGNSYRVVADKLGCSQTTVGLWRRRFLEEGLEGYRAVDGRILFSLSVGSALHWVRP